MNHPVSVAPNVNHIEGRQPANRQTTQSRVRQQLRPMQPDDRLYDLEFDHDLDLDRRVRPVSCVEMRSSVGARRTELRLQGQGRL
jgi:hypothetical protein